MAIREDKREKPMTAIVVRNLRKQFNSLVAVDDVSFTVAEGEAFGLLGPNGAGKTTTINMLVGFWRPDQGEIQIKGASDPTRPSVRQQIGNAPQDLALYEDLTGWENLAFFGRLYNMKSSALKERATWALELTGLIDRKNHKVKTYSGGMMRRLNLACALIHDPSVLLLDEPTVGVDPQSRSLLADQIEELKEAGRTIIYTTHYMEEAQRLCDRVAIIDHGKILALDTVEGLIAQHGGTAVIEGELFAVPEDADSLPGLLEGTHLRVETDEPLEELARLSERGVRFSQVRIERADLETVFLNLTGRRLRD
jgi:ABC-2 type transport system ATP-binding protein